MTPEFIKSYSTTTPESPTSIRDVQVGQVAKCLYTSPQNQFDVMSEHGTIRSATTFTESTRAPFEYNTPTLYRFPPRTSSIGRIERDDVVSILNHESGRKPDGTVASTFQTIRRKAVPGTSPLSPM